MLEVLRNQQNNFDGEDLDELPSELRVINLLGSPVSILSKEKDSNGKPIRILYIPAYKFESLIQDELEKFEYEDLLQKKSIRLKPIEPDFTLVNKTSRRIAIGAQKKGGDSLIIPAFGSRKVSLSVLGDYNYRSWKQRNLIDVKREYSRDEKNNLSEIISLYSSIFWVLVFGGLTLQPFITDAIPLAKDNYLWIYGGCIGVALIVGILLLGWTQVKRSLNWSLLISPFVRFINLLFLISSALIPIALVMYFFGGGPELLMQQTLTLGVLVRGFQFLIILLLSLLPGILYYQFERQQVTSVKERLFQEIMMLNPNVVTLDDARIMYGGLVDEVSGMVGENNQQYSLLGAGIPVLLTTWLVSLGWLFTINPIGSVAELANEQLATFLYPGPSPLGFAFIGAYFFALQLILRRYARGDLTPKTYNHVIVRILATLMILWVISQITVLDTSISMIIAFFIGIFPDDGLALAQNELRNAAVRSRSLEEKHPITDLDGINLYDQARLLEEGIESIENLVHYNLIELLLRTRMPTPRLVDLVDQGILYIHVVDKQGNKNALERLREFGIRTATDLLQVYNLSSKKDDFLLLLGPDGDVHPKRLQMIIDAMRDDEWIDYLLHWRETCQSSQVACKLEDFYPTKPTSHQP